MNNTEYLLLVFSMTLVTYLPRMLPSIIIDKMRFGAGTEKFLRLIPFTAIASLIFPGVFFVDGANPFIGIAGALVAGLLAWRRFPVMVCVLAAIAMNFLQYSFL